MYTRIILSIILIGILTLTLVPKPFQSALGCSCAPITPTEAFKQSTTVFTGQIIDIETNSTTHDVIASFNVEKILKGDTKKIITVLTSSDSSLCGYEFKQNEKYFVYAYGKDSIRTDSCSRTKPLSYANDDLVELEKQIKISHLSPRQQMKNGILAEDVTCSEGLVLIKKLSKNSVACVTPTTADKLVGRGWQKILT